MEGKIKDIRGTINFKGYASLYTLGFCFDGYKGVSRKESIGATYAGRFLSHLPLPLIQKGLNLADTETSVKFAIENESIEPCNTRINLSYRVKYKGLIENKLEELYTSTRVKCPASRLYDGGTAIMKAKAELI